MDMQCSGRELPVRHSEPTRLEILGHLHALERVINDRFRREDDELLALAHVAGGGDAVHALRDAATQHLDHKYNRYFVATGILRELLANAPAS